ncbi:MULTISPECIES: CRISPR-associated protein Cas5 [Bacillus cereus group]
MGFRVRSTLAISTPSTVIGALLSALGVE